VVSKQYTASMLHANGFHSLTLYPDASVVIQLNLDEGKRIPLSVDRARLVG